jgi:Zn-dependent peptidase ImmA (M78 family)
MGVIIWWDMSGNPESSASRLLDLAWKRDDGRFPLPVEPAEIAKDLGLKYYVADLGPRISGMLVRQPGRDTEIHVSRDDGHARQRFSCAHELGHYVYRSPGEGLPTDEGDGSVCFRDDLAGKGTDPEEIWANNFAAALLMPSSFVQAARLEFPEIAILAGKFRVSAEAMRVRLENLDRRGKARSQSLGAPRRSAESR